jgi:uncharacterized damage-inducible protein DinB
MANNPPWLRGPVPDVIPMLQPVAHSLIDCLEDVESRLAGVSAERLWAKPGTAASTAFHVRHAMGSLERLFTYARGEQLSPEQLEAIKVEGVRGTGPDTAEELIDAFRVAVDRAMKQVRAVPETTLMEFRAVGRARAPSNVLGILVHAAEHTQRHIGQMSTTLKIV